MSVAQILQQLAQQAGQRHRARGALIGGTIADLSQVPGQIIADREQQRAAHVQAQRQQQQDSYARDANARANSDQVMQDQAGQAEQREQAIAQDIIGVYVANEPNNPSTNNLVAAEARARELGRPDWIMKLRKIDKEERQGPKLTEFNPEHGSQDAAGNVVRQPVAKVEKVAEPKLETRGLDVQAADALARGDQATYDRLKQVKKEMGQADDRPRITVNTGNATKDRRVDARTKAFEALPLVKRTVTMAESVGFANGMDVNTKNPADDQALIYAYAKAMDPDSVVREGEYATVKQYAQTWAQNLGFKAERIFSNSAFLTPEARRNMKTTISAKFAAAKKQYDGARSSFENQINQITGEKNGADYLTDFGTAFPTPPGAAPAPAVPGAPKRIRYDMNGNPVPQ